MIAAFVIALVLALTGWMARLWVLAIREEHLMVLELEAGSFLLERQRDGRFALVHPLALPLALARFELRRMLDRYAGCLTPLARPWHRVAAHLH